MHGNIEIIIGNDTDFCFFNSFNSDAFCNSRLRNRSRKIGFCIALSNTLAAVLSYSNDAFPNLSKMGLLAIDGEDDPRSGDVIQEIRFSGY